MTRDELAKSLGVNHRHIKDDLLSEIETSIKAESDGMDRPASDKVILHWIRRGMEIASDIETKKDNAYKEIIGKRGE